ncbi:MAG TPA: hypothetical protein QF564_20745, partial [Pirellulaceae bacterium]|nr:hypothetical protein [Pirellulaceae bacterium]
GGLARRLLPRGSWWCYDSLLDFLKPFALWWRGRLFFVATSVVVVLVVGSATTSSKSRASAATASADGSPVGSAMVNSGASD